MDGEFVYDSGEYMALAFTIKKLGPRRVDLCEYTEVIASWKNKFSNSVMIEDFISEFDSSNKLHVHGIIYVRKNFFKRRLQVKGFHVYTTDMYSKDQWLLYMHKVDNNQYMF